jgi:hypothetical protein
MIVLALAPIGLKFLEYGRRIRAKIDQVVLNPLGAKALKLLDWQRASVSPCAKENPIRGNHFGITKR